MIDWLGVAVHIELDASCVWDTREHGGEDMNPLDEFQQWMVERIESDSEGIAAQIVDSVRRKPRPASLWRRILVVAASFPAQFAEVLRPLMQAPEALTSLDLSTLIGEFLKSAFTLFPAESRRQIEEAILGLPDTLAASSDDREAARCRGERARDRLLGCLPDDALTTDAARSRLAELRGAGGVPANTPPFGPIETVIQDWTEKDRLATQGVDIDAPANKHFMQLREPVALFAANYTNTSPDAAEAIEIESALRGLWTALQDTESPVATKLADMGWGDVSRAAEAIVRSDDLTVDTTVFALAREVLLQAAQHELPAPRYETSQFDESPSWNSPAPRVEAVEGLTTVAHREEPSSEDVLRTLEAMCLDDAPEVRLALARRLPLLRGVAPDVMWRLADQLVRDERSTVVLTAVATVLPRIASSEQSNRLQEGLTRLFELGGREVPGADELRQQCVAIMTGLYIWRGYAKSGHFVRDVIIAGLAADPADASAIVHQLREPLTVGDHPSENAHLEIRARAVEIAVATLEAAFTTIRNQADELRANENRSDDDLLIRRTQVTSQLIQSLSDQIYFASGAYSPTRNATSRLPAAGEERFYMEAGNLLDMLSEIPIAAVTHRVLETLEFFISTDPRGVFLRIRRAVVAGRGGAYELDSQGARLVVRLIERYLAEHRTLLQEDSECRQAMVEILDIFVSVGWPEARLLTYGLQEIFR